MAEATLLSVDGVQASYGSAQALFDVGFELRAGEVITLLGRNGTGRSTTIQCLMGMLPVKAGSIHYRGQPISNLASYKIARMGLGLVPEGRQVFPTLSVEENLVATARPAAAGTTRTPWNVARVYGMFPRLEERRRNLGSQLSGGEQQMLAISRALMTNPEILVLDEATEGLAPVVRDEIWKALAELKRQGMSLIVIDKNLKPLLALSDRHYVLDKGRVLWGGSSAELSSQPDLIHRYLGI